MADCSGDTQAGLKWLRRAGYDIPQSARLEYDQKLHYVTVTFTLTDDMKRRIDRLLIDGGQEGLDRTGWLYTFVPHYNICSEGFVLGKMDNDTSECLLVVTMVRQSTFCSAIVLWRLGRCQASALSRRDRGVRYLYQGP